MQSKTTVAPARASVRPVALLASTRRRSTRACSGPLPDRVSTVTGLPSSASWRAMVEPTGPAPMTMVLMASLL